MRNICFTVVGFLKNCAVKSPFFLPSSLYDVMCIIRLVSFSSVPMGLNNNWSTWMRAYAIETGGRKCAHCMSLVRFSLSLAYIFDVGGLENLSGGTHRAYVGNIHCLRLETHCLINRARYTDWWTETYIHTYIHTYNFVFAYLDAANKSYT